MEIAPGGHSEVDVEYRAASRTADEWKIVSVHFTDPTVAPVRLNVVAKVREPMTINPSELYLPDVGGDFTSDCILEVENFDVARWDGLQIRSSAAWVHPTATLIGESADPNRPRQKWAVNLHLDARDLSAGEHGESLTIAAFGGAPVNVIPLRVVVGRPISAIPSEIFFGRIKKSQVRVERQVLIRFAKSLGVVDVAACVASVEPDHGLSVTWADSKGRFPTLSVAVDPERAGVGHLRWEVRVEVRGNIGDDRAISISIPVVALLVDDGDGGTVLEQTREAGKYGD